MPKQLIHEHGAVVIDADGSNLCTGFAIDSANLKRTIDINLGNFAKGPVGGIPYEAYEGLYLIEQQPLHSPTNKPWTAVQTTFKIALKLDCTNVQI